MVVSRWESALSNISTRCLKKSTVSENPDVELEEDLELEDGPLPPYIDFTLIFVLANSLLILSISAVALLMAASILAAERLLSATAACICAWALSNAFCATSS